MYKPNAALTGQQFGVCSLQRAGIPRPPHARAEAGRSGRPLRGGEGGLPASPGGAEGRRGALGRSAAGEVILTSSHAAKPCLQFHLGSYQLLR